MDPPYPPVENCTMEDCVYYRRRKCRAATISVGSADEAVCHSYSVKTGEIPENDHQAAVRSCEMHMCLRNRDQACIAYRVHIRADNGRPLCKSFKNRYK